LNILRDERASQLRKKEHELVGSPILGQIVGCRILKRMFYKNNVTKCFTPILTASNGSLSRVHRIQSSWLNSLPYLVRSASWTFASENVETSTSA
jgi:hypothetical protein